MELKINLCPAKISEFEHTKRLAWEIERQCPLVNTHMEYKWDKKWIDLVIYDNKDIIRAICECKNRRGRTDTQIGKREQITTLKSLTEGICDFFVVIYEKKGVNYVKTASEIVRKLREQKGVD